MAAPPLPPPNRSQHNYSPSSTAGSDWSGMNNYNGGLRPDFQPPTRGDSITPPEGGFEPRPPHRAQTFAAGSPTEPQPRRGPSEDGSRASSRAGSSRTSDISLRDPRSLRYQRAESELRQHYAVLRAYLRGGAAQPPRANKARDKLLRLSAVQFHELSTDVFDELQRRQAASPLPGRPPRQDKVPPFLQPRSDFHEKRNQARQKLSSLQTSRFRDLSTDVFCELERRFPHFNPDNKRESVRSISRGPPSRPPNGVPPANGFGPPPRAHTTHGSVSSNASFARKGPVTPVDTQPNSASEFGRPMPKQFQNNTVIPNKSTMVEDDDEDDTSPMGRYDRSSEAFGLESSLTSPRSNRDTSATSLTGGSRDPPSDELQQKVAELENKLGAKEAEIVHLSTAVSLKNELQEKLDQAVKLNSEMKEEIERMRQEHASSAEGGEWRDKHDELEQQHQSLQEQYQRQMQSTEEVSKQFRAHLADMRALADENSGSMQREEQLHMEVQRLREEAAEWKGRYTRVKTQLKNVRVSTIGLNMESAKKLGDQSFYEAGGLVRDLHVTRFQLAIDELLGGARAEEPGAVLDHIKNLVVAVRSITGDVEAAGDDKSDETTRKRHKLKAKVSATANNVITATKNYAAAQGLSPVSLVDAAASHLTAAVIDLLRTVKIRSTPAGELADEKPHMTPVNKNGYFNIGGSVRRPSNADSIYSALSDPSEPDPRTPVGPTHDQSYVDGNKFSGLGIDASQLQQDDVELEELKVRISQRYE